MTKFNLTPDQEELMKVAIECDGAEIPEPWWEDAEVLVKKGLATLSNRRGPGGAFKRIMPVTKPVYELDDNG